MTDDIDLRTGHLDDDTLDRLRAGLLDEDPTAPALRRHLEDCPRCRARTAAWDRIREAWQDGPSIDPATAAALRVRRRTVLAGEPTRRFPTLALATVAAVLMLAVGLYEGVVPGFFQADDRKSVQVVQVVDDTPDLYADIDFYLWMSEREHGAQGQNDC